MKVKRIASPADDSPSKRQCIREYSVMSPRLTLQDSLSHELILKILGYLTASELINLATLNSAFYQIVQDSQLWKSLFLSMYAKKQLETTTRSRPWKQLYKISKNWRDGKATSLRRAILPKVPINLDLDNQETVIPSTVQPQENEPDTILQIYKEYFITASRSPVSKLCVPNVTISTLSENNQVFVIKTLESERMKEYYITRNRPTPLSTTEMRLDERSQSSFFQLIVFYSTGQFSIFRVLLGDQLTYKEIYTHLGLSSSLLIDPICLARFRSPIIVTCSRRFQVHFYHTMDGSTFLCEKVGPTFQSEQSWFPATLDLKESNQTSDDNSLPTYQITLCSVTPVFPSSSSISIQQFIVTASVPSQYEFHLRSSRLKDEYSKLDSSLITSLEYRDGWVVASRSNNTIDVLQILISEGFTLTPSIKTPYILPPLIIVPMDKLFGHTAGVSSVILTDAAFGLFSCESRLNTSMRCISAGGDGLRLWGLGRRKTREPDLPVTVSTKEDLSFKRFYPQVKRSDILKIVADADKIVGIHRPALNSSGENIETVEVVSFD